MFSFSRLEGCHRRRPQPPLPLRGRTLLVPPYGGILLLRACVPTLKGECAYHSVSLARPRGRCVHILVAYARTHAQERYTSCVSSAIPGRPRCLKTRSSPSSTKVLNFFFLPGAGRSWSARRSS